VRKKAGVSQKGSETPPTNSLFLVYLNVKVSVCDFSNLIALLMAIQQTSGSPSTTVLAKIKHQNFT